MAVALLLALTLAACGGGGDARSPEDLAANLPTIPDYQPSKGALDSATSTTAAPVETTTTLAPTTTVAPPTTAAPATTVAPAPPPPTTQPPPPAPTTTAPLVPVTTAVRPTSTCVVSALQNPAYVGGQQVLSITTDPPVAGKPVRVTFSVSGVSFPAQSGSTDGGGQTTIAYDVLPAGGSEWSVDARVVIGDVKAPTASCSTKYVSRT